MGTEWNDAERWETARRLALSMRLDAATAEDVAQETERKLRDAGEHGASRALVLTVARNAAIDALRRLAREKRRDGGPVDEQPLPSPGPSAETLTYEREVFAQVAAKLHEMPTSPRVVITKHYLEGMSLVEIVAWREGDSPRGDGETALAHHKRCNDWVHQNHARGLGWLRERVAR